MNEELPQINEITGLSMDYSGVFGPVINNYMIIRNIKYFKDDPKINQIKSLITTSKIQNYFTYYFERDYDKSKIINNKNVEKVAELNSLVNYINKNFIYSKENCCLEDFIDTFDVEDFKTNFNKAYFIIHNENYDFN